MFAGALSTAIALVVLTSRADAHGYLKQPEPDWKDSPNPGWITMVDNYWDIGSGGDQVGKFKTMAKEKGMSVKDVVLDMVKDQKCGNTVENGSPKPIPSDGKVKWFGHRGGGFTHVGPCEIYLDDKMVLHGDDCEEEYPGGSDGSSSGSEMPVDFSSCNGKCTLTIYWLAFQNAQWQTYVNCVPLSGSGGSTTQTQGSQTSSQTSETSTIQGSSAGKDKEKSPAADAPSTEQQSPSTEQKETEAPKTDNKDNDAPSSDQKENETPNTDQKENKGSNNEEKKNEAPNTEQKENDSQNTDQKENKSPSSDQKDNQPPSSDQQSPQAPSPEQQWTQAPSNNQQPTPAPPSNQQQWTPAPANNQQPTSAPANNQQPTQAPSNDQQNNQQQEQQQQQSPSTEQRSSVNFNTLNGGTGTVQPSTNLRL
ncbi:hypothetical protein F443_20926 [Phytophthora nicotianae P1569]|uniref:Uncharacterized protein n=1 Tax=Phytophthora nicotianae P1569 TaxID=1317065 RepID=V9E0Y7_PHYNI|nr:hypothetical protein F443_20926 [Phytophthora nicotianae P1569]